MRHSLVEPAQPDLPREPYRKRFARVGKGLAAGGSAPIRCAHLTATGGGVDVKIRKEDFFASLMAMGLLGAAGCGGGGEEQAEPSGTETTTQTGATGGEDMFAEPPAPPTAEGTTTDDGGMAAPPEEPMEEAPSDMGPTPE